VTDWGIEPEREAAADSVLEVGAARARANAEPARRPPRRVLARLGAVAFWGSGISLLIGAASSGGFLALAFVPLLGFGYLVFCLIALTCDRNVE